ncbi:MAG: hypothetical protein WC812_04610 [Candidatus Pacearchaeota archaeon]|jgi:hypothetical protein
MKKIFFALVLILLLIPFVLSIETEINSNYSKGETVIAKVTGNFLENIQKSDISFYRRHLSTSFIPYDVIKIENDFYISVKIGEEKISDDYSIVIKGVPYMNGSKTSNEDIVLNFTILNSTADFSVWPGAIISDTDYSLKVQNLKENSIEIFIDGVDIATPTNNNETNESTSGGFFSWLFKNSVTNETTDSGLSGDSITLLSGEIKELEFSATNKTQKTSIKLSSTNTEYIIPAYLIYNSENFNYSSEENNTIINETINESSEDEELTDEEIEEMENEEIFEEDGILKSCVQLNGTVCQTTETCNGTKQYASNVTCCIGNCIKEEKNSKTTKIIGWILIAIVAIVILYVIKTKSKKSKKPVSSSGIFGKN